MQIDLLARQVKLNGYTLDLTSTEYKLLVAISETVGQAMSREVLSRTIQPGAYIPSDRSVDVQISRLRKKLSDADSQHEWITTVRGEGYVFTHCPQS
jgi:DNA-binding response OmpR family regulator